MNRIFTLILCCILFIPSSYSQKREINENGKYKGIIRIKFDVKSDQKATALNQLLVERKKLKVKSTEDFVRTNIPNLDKVNQRFKANKMRRVFRDAGKFEARHKKHGLHLWYEVEFSTTTPVTQLLKSYEGVAEISIAEGINATRQITGVPSTATNLSVAPAALPSGTNDPLFGDQWHYENTGQNDGTAGKDISLLEAWQIETGNPNVIVAIEDGGIDFDHIDLAANMWVNPGEIAGNGIDDDNNGYVDDIYGYNFGDDTGDIYVGDHGTHVAGTVAAVSNNGVGVSGIAGGSGNNDGVRLMSCNVFSASTGGFAEAYSYAADNGAVISQNSWSYSYPYQYDQAVLDGIDYFIANAGGPNAPMNGGIVIFAAGNDNSESRYYPAYYDNVLSVAATNKNDERSYYSNYGTWVDIAAPGGELETTNEDPTAIHSTYPNDNYGVMQGTSMACPHVSGVAALVISKYAGNITPTELWNKLVDNTDPIDDLNDSRYAGKLGSGRLNAFKALSDDNLPSVPSGLTATNVTQTSFTVGWTAVSGATSYDLQVREEGGTWQTINTSELTYDYSGATAETTYEFQVRANNDAGSSGYSAMASVITEAAPTVPDAPVNLSASNITYNSITITWDAVADADDYDLDVRPSGGSWTTVALTTTSYDYSGLDAETTYEFQVRANNSIGASANSDLASATTLAAPTAPDAPVNLSASNITYNSLTVTWDAVTDANDYDLDVRPAGGSWTTVALATTSYDYTGLDAETTYEFQVRANNSIGASANSSLVSATTLVAPTAPEVPTNIIASSITFNSFTISWDAMADTEDYDVNVRASGGSWTTINTLATSYDYSGLDAETTYEFQVRANNGIGSSDYSNISSATTLVGPTAPEVPTNVMASNITYNSLTISWDATTDADDYDVNMRVSGGTWTAVNVSATTYDLTGLDAETTYEFQVRANNGIGSSSYSVAISATTLEAPTPPDAPANVMASNITYNSFTISWDVAADADNYDLDIREEGGNWSSVNTSATTYDFSSALASTNYEFKVRSNNSIGSGAYSAVGLLTTEDIPVPAIPTGVLASDITSNSFTISWNSAEFANNYDVQIREQGGNWETFTTSATDLSYNTAMAETTYEFQVLASNTSGSSDYSALQSLTTLAEASTPDYCDSYGKATRYEYIDLVEFADMSNPSGDDGGYGDYTGMVANVAPGNSYTLNFSSAYKSRTYTTNWKIYIDFNRDGEFTTNERVVSGYSASSGVSSSNVSVPAGAALGQTRMRVILKHRRAARTACDIFSQGEVEDYTINISNSAPAMATKSSSFGFTSPLSQTPPIEELKLYPNPAKDYVSLYIQGNIQSKVRISSLTGKTIRILTLDQEDNRIDVSNLPSGMYFISIEDGEEIISKKLIKL
ncbi:fibronectin type III domain-containing protein [Labilibaculum sp. DW002]|uniref:Fibronectin type III domain-containing protein n=1 Tax=Paralabilibaculum antarcticum TaxID=2912572 RepID=A0ABT5VPY4_9BACT|nr:fibronectin type III domain-containing protein [Labilibaculum sp. DW002]MDE5417489.1 fibronectin type III domain-containing protein [Labilibaculum sp. DW002]